MATRSSREVTPRSLVLDLLRVTPEPGAAPVKSLVEIAALFGFNSSAVRVAIARLVRGGMLESDLRGCYRLAPDTERVSRWVEDWRLGDARLRPWSGGYLAVAGLKSADRSAVRRSLRALSRLGFQRGLGSIFVRPDNFTADLDATRTLLEDFGLAPGAELFVASEFSPAMRSRFSRTLWPIDKLRARQRRAIAALERSEKRLPKLEPAEAVVESFIAGGDAIRTLALDPLLPEELMSGEDRRALTELMLRYDKNGRGVWQTFVDEHLLARPERPEPRLKAVRGGRS